MTEEWEFDPEPPPPDGNPMGLAGFILSLVGLATCGLISSQSAAPSTSDCEIPVSPTIKLDSFR